jgi:N-acetylglucosamine-6-phosphate deacetylase
MLIRGRHYASGKMVDLTWSDGRIVEVASAGDARPDREAGWIAPALFDLQINGCHGRNFSSLTLTAGDVRHVIDTCRAHGVAGLCPTLVTNSFAALAHGFDTLHQACETDAVIAHAVPGFHLEGPYISAEDGPRGAHAKLHVRPPDWDEFRRLQEAAGGRIRLVTLAPETTGALVFIEKLVASGVVVALGHTAASGPQIRDAIRAGARLSTHLGNGSHALLPRHDNYLWHQLAADELWASVICDGHHLPREVVRSILRVKSPARVILTCDGSPLAGLPPGRYHEWDQDFDVLPGGKVVVPGTTYLAGSGVLTDACVNQILAWGEVSLVEAIDMASVRPRQLLGLPECKLEPGSACDVMLFNWEPGRDFRITGMLTTGATGQYNG